MADELRYEEAVARYEPLSDYERGLVDGIYRYAWMRDGTFYVGTTGSTLGQAVDRALAEARGSSDVHHPDGPLGPKSLDRLEALTREAHRERHEGRS